MATPEASKLTLLLPTTPYTLAYTLPLLLLSTLLVFSGTFITLDRTRSFPPSKGGDYSVVPGPFELKPNKRRFSWYLEGGIGGVAIGYTLGVHVSTLLALLIPVTTSASPLSPKSFLAVWILSCIPTAILGGRYRPAALVFAGLEGGTFVALGLSVILHPSRLPRLILLGVFTTLFTFLILASAFIPRLSVTLLHPVLRVCTSAVGAFGFVVSISLLVTPRAESWADVWERLWLHNGEKWGAGTEQGLSAAWGILWILGIGSDWTLHRYFGECPDEKWDEYLSKYVSDLPNRKDRAGTFQPLTGFWEKLFGAPQKDYDLFNAKRTHDIIFPSDKDMKSPFNVQPFTEPHQLDRRSSIAKIKMVEDEIPSSKTFLKKSRSQKRTTSMNTKAKSRKPIKFGAIDELSSDSDGEALPPYLKAAKTQRPWVITSQQTSYASSTPTLVGGRKTPGRSPNTYVTEPGNVELDYDKELEQLRKTRGDKDDYSDQEGGGTDEVEREVDLGLQRSLELSPTFSSRSGSPRGGETWSPAFLQRHRDTSDLGGPPRLQGAMPIPATPSLIRAVDRIERAQREIYTPLSAGTPKVQSGHGPSPTPARRAGDVVDDDLRLEDGKIVEEVELVGTAQARHAPRWEEFWREVKVKAQT